MYFQRKEKRFPAILVAGEAISLGELVCIKAADGLAYKSDANDVTLMPVVGFAGEDAALGAPVEVITLGKIAGFTALTKGGAVYASETAGETTQAAPTVAQQVGRAVSATEISIDIAPVIGTLGEGSVTALHLAADAVEAAEVANGSIVAAKLAANAVETAKIKDLQVTTGKLAANAVTGAKASANVIAKQVMSTAIDLSGAAVVDEILLHATEAVTLVKATLLYKEASSADAGVAVTLGKEGSAAYFYTGDSEVSKAAWYEKNLTLLQTALPAGNTLLAGCAGGKVGTGEVYLVVEYTIDDAA